jgi:hypothetical protein
MDRRALLHGLARGALGLALGAAALPLAPLPPARAAGGGYAVQVTQVLATGENEEGPRSIDPALKDLAAQLERYPFRVFKRVGLEKKLLAEGEPETFALSADPGFTLKVRPRAEGAMVKLDLRVLNKEQAEILITEVKVKDGGSAIVAKELDDRSGRLFIAVTVKRKRE